MIVSLCEWWPFIKDFKLLPSYYCIWFGQMCLEFSFASFKNKEQNNLIFQKSLQLI